MTSGVIQSQPMSIVPGSTEPMRPVKVKTVQVKSGGLTRLASATPQPMAPATRNESVEPMSLPQQAARAELPPQPAGFGTGNGVLGVLPASSLPPGSSSQAMAYATPAPQISAPLPQPQQQASLQDASAKSSVTRSGWIIQVGALESAAEAQQRIDAARNHAQGLLNKADPFTETVSKNGATLVRARFAGLDRDQAEAVCKKLKRADISCMTMHN
jgi:D-alanyl-D-alanine carboxypeptidase